MCQLQKYGQHNSVQTVEIDRLITRQCAHCFSLIGPPRCSAHTRADTWNSSMHWWLTLVEQVHILWNKCTLYFYKFSVLFYFQYFRWSMVLPELKRHLNEKNTLKDHDTIHRHQNLNLTERSVIARYRNLNTPKICKFTVHFSMPDGLRDR